MCDWPVGFSTGCFYKKSIFECLEDIRLGGFCMLEICSSPDHLDYHDRKAVHEASHLIKELGMEAYSFHAPYGSQIDVTSLDYNTREYSKNEFIQAAYAASELGVRYFVTHPGPETYFQVSSEEKMERMKNAAMVLNEIAHICQQLGIGFVLENMLPHLFLGNSRDMLWIMGAIDSMNIGACLDTGHANLTGNIYRVLYKLSGNIKMIHANDNLGKGDDHLPPGTGNINWSRILFELKDRDFRGGFILELSGFHEKKVADTMQEAREARNHIRQISKKILFSASTSVHSGFI